MGSNSASSTTSYAQQSQNQVAQEGDGFAVSAGDGARIIVTADEAFELGEAAIQATAEAAEASVQIVGSAFGDILKFSEDNARGSLELVSESLSQVGRSHDVLSAALDAQTTANKSEAGQIGEQLVKVGLPALAIAFVAYGIFRK